MRLRTTPLGAFLLFAAIALLSPVDPSAPGANHGASRGLGLSSALADTPKDSGKSDADKGKQEKPTVEATDTLYGNSAVFSKPSEVDVDMVFEKIDEYRQIKDKGIETSDPQHAILLGKASRKFNCAVKKAAKAGRYDLVAKKGTVHGLADVPDLTSDVIDRL